MLNSNFTFRIIIITEASYLFRQIKYISIRELEISFNDQIHQVTKLRVIGKQ
jgi:hypothetical protein